MNMRNLVCLAGSAAFAVVAFGQQDLDLQDHVVHLGLRIHLHENHPDRVTLDPGKWGYGKFLQHQ